ncbi:hypothetical protein [Sphingobacterium sp.]|uniref:hypothetical protein n=1 Tax=Sphingobacterium sp. TaxID=341027 RepID=UPI0031D79162
MKKGKLYLVSLATSAILLSACNNQTPQEKATDQMEKAENKALASSEDATATFESAAAKNTEAVIYSNIAAANEAISKIPPPQLSNTEAKSLYTRLGKTVVDRINAKTALEAMDKEDAIQKIKNDSARKLQAGKITQSDYDNILKYLADCFAASKSIN